MDPLIDVFTVAAGIEGGLKREVVRYLLPNDVVMRLSKDPSINISASSFILNQCCRLLDIGRVLTTIYHNLH